MLPSSCHSSLVVAATWTSTHWQTRSRAFPSSQRKRIGSWNLISIHYSYVRVAVVADALIVTAPQARSAAA
jgi:hypothetical protein